MKDMVKDQFLIMMLDEERAIAALPKLLPQEPREREALKAAIRRVLSATGELSEEDKRRLARVEALFASAGETRKAAEKQPSLVQG
jgi:hypothetical protein